MFREMVIQNFSVLDRPGARWKIWSSGQLGRQGFRLGADQSVGDGFCRGLLYAISAVRFSAIERVVGHASRSQLGMMIRNSSPPYRPTES